MMPGESQSRTVPIASDATVGKCQNCSVLNQSLAEYVSSLLALKQKITVSDDSIRLQQQLEELQIKLVTLEKKTADYECVQAELQEKKSALKACGHMAEEMEQLKQENGNIIAQKNDLEDQLRDVKELLETQSLENAQLKREKAAVENDLLETQTSLKNCQARADQVEELMQENAKQTSIKESLEKKVGLLEESVCKQNSQISQLTKEKILLEGNIHDLQTRLVRLERERCKDYRSISTQASVPEEPKVDKEKLRMLLESLWTCVEPQLQESSNMLHLPEPNFKPRMPSSPPKSVLSHLSNTPPPVSHKISDPYSSPVRTKATHIWSNSSPRGPKAKKPQTTNCEKKSDSPKKSVQLFTEHKTEESSTDFGSSDPSIEEIMIWFRPLHPCLSPLPDLQPAIEPMETEDGGKLENSSGDSVPLGQRKSVFITSPSDHCSQSSVPSTKDDVDFPGLSAQEVEQISSENQLKDSGQNELSGDTEMKDESCSDSKAVHPKEELQTEQNPASLHLLPACPSSLSRTADTAVLPEVPSLTTESQEQLCSIDLSTCGTESELEKAKEHPSEVVTESDVKTSPRAVSSAEAVSAEGEAGESPRRRDPVEISEEGDPALFISSAASSTCVESVTNTEVTDTENDAEPGGIQQDCRGSGESSQDVTAFKSPESKECMSEDTHTSGNNPGLPCSTESISSVSCETEAVKLQNDVAIKPLTEEGGNEAREPTLDASVSPSGSNGADGPPSPSESLALEEVDTESHADQEADEANNRTPPQNDVEMETLDSEVLAAPSDSQEAVDCESWKENVHSACKSSNPPHSLPSVQHQASETELSPKELMIDVDTELNAAKNEPIQSVPDSEEVEAPNEDLPVDGSEQEVSRCEVDTVHLTASVNSSTEGQNTCLESSKDGLKNSQEIREDDCSPGAGSTTVPTPESLGVVRSEMGPPLPRVLTPLSTPPKPGKSINPRQAIGKLLFPSPMERLASPTTPTQAQLTPSARQLSSSSLSSPLPPSGVPSSPLQFGSATPKHAVPVPGRLPMAAMTSSPSSSSSPSQENSMRILDTMYPEMSAHGRTLSILRGNLGICTSESGALPTAAVSQMSGFKTINSASTAFTKTETRGEKRRSENLPQPGSSKCLRLDTSSPSVSRKQVPSSSSGSEEEPTPSQPLSEAASSTLDNAEPTEKDPIASALRKIENQSFDLLPVIQSHLHVGNLPKKPVLRAEEKEVIAEICQSRIVDDMISTILDKLKAEKGELSTNFLQALCRVYTGLCRQTGAWEKARVLAYCILTEDFPDCAKLILFMVSTWPGVLSHPGSMCQAIHTVTKLKAQENLLSCLSAFLGWEKSPPCDIDELLSRTVSEVRSGSDLSFITHSRHGDDLGPKAWEHVFTLHILCAHKKWIWTYETIMGKQLWPIMNDWVTQPRNQRGPISDVTVATVLRLIGRLGQIGLKERRVSSVQTVASVITTFCKHAQAEGVPWQVQLASIYCIHELSPWNPREALNVLAEWRGEMSNRVPPAITSCINQLASVCRQASK